MFPIGDDNSGERSFPVVTYALIVLNVLFFLVELNGGDSFIQQWSLVPRRLLANPAGDFPTIFTSMFMHAGWIHLLGNTLYLWIFGDNVEDSFGHAISLRQFQHRTKGFHQLLWWQIQLQGRQIRGTYRVL
jgi:membrane associated rhomboid family serine protease